LADAGVPFKRLEPLVEIPWMIGQSGEQAFFRMDETERVEQPGFHESPSASMIGEEAVMSGDTLNS
jgi:hypothetical protein